MNTAHKGGAIEKAIGAGRRTAMATPMDIRSGKATTITEMATIIVTNSVSRYINI